MNDELPESLAPAKAPPRRLLMWFLAVALVVGIIFLLPKPEQVVPPGEAVETGVAAMLEPDAELNADDPATDAAAVAAGAAVPGTESAAESDGVSEAGSSDSRPSAPPEKMIALATSGAADASDDSAAAPAALVDPSLENLFGDRPALIAVRPDPFVVTADGRRFVPGDQLDAGVVLELIEDESLHFSQDGRVFSLAAFAPDLTPAAD